ncbi:imidazole glycerol phosphate synthase subunit HisH [Candidatus Poriferisocius sp.]|uniref:imidazole glycerol phosphate synthase subunit HisH n=1 Tax=Candidatus Poriferisocius sp. TaxID=3101276 RepID=UPI003B010CAB
MVLGELGSFVSRPLIAVLDYGIGNLRSAQKSLERMGADARLTADPGLIAEAAGVVLPGVGAFGPCMVALRDTGLDEQARAAAVSGRPFLGICIGLQLLYEGSEEAPGTAGLGVLPGTVRLLSGTVKRPQMQWNRLEARTLDPMLEGLGDAWVYFVHSYAAPMADNVVATCDYGGPVAAVVADGNVWATQFHPEKSARPGLRLLENFVNHARTAAVGA